MCYTEKKLCSCFYTVSSTSILEKLRSLFVVVLLLVFRLLLFLFFRLCFFLWFFFFFLRALVLYSCFPFLYICSFHIFVPRYPFPVLFSLVCNSEYLMLHISHICSPYLYIAILIGDKGLKLGFSAEHSTIKVHKPYIVLLSFYNV